MQYFRGFLIFACAFVVLAPASTAVAIAPACAFCSCGYLAPMRSIILRRLSIVSSFAFSTKAQDFTLACAFCSCGYLASVRLSRLTGSIILRRLRSARARVNRGRYRTGLRFLLLWVSRANALDYPTSPINSFIFRFLNESSRFHSGLRFLLLWVSRLCSPQSAHRLDYPTSPINSFIFRFLNESSRFHSGLRLFDDSQYVFYRKNFIFNFVDFYICT